MQIAFVRSSAWTSRLIQWFTGSKWSHVMLVLDATLDGDRLVLEATHAGGVKLSLLSGFNPQHLEVYDTDPEDWNITPVKRYLGVAYGTLQIIGFALAKLLKLKHNPIGKGVICSELVLMYLLHSPFADEFKDLEINKTSPQDLYEIISISKTFRLI